MEGLVRSSRRKFMITVTAAGAAILLDPLWSTAANEVDPRVAAIVARTIGIDTHNHIEVPLNTSELPGPAVDFIGDIKKSGLSAICMTFAVDYQKLISEGDAYNRFMSGLTALDQILTSHNIRRSLNLSDIKASHKNYQPAAIQSVEGGHFLEGKLERLKEAYDRGLRHLGLLHDNDASVPLGDIYTKPPQWGGLTPFGSDVIRECNKLGILVDLTHCSNDTINAALKVTTKPVLISHTGLDTQLGPNPDMANMMKPRLISKAQAKIVAEAGGVIGLWTHLAESPLAYAQNIRAMVDVVGVDHVCIGTDTKMTTPYRPPGQSKRPARIGERTNGAWENQTTGFYYTVVDAMLQTGFVEREIEKIGGGNFCKIFDAATSGP